MAQILLGTDDGVRVFADDADATRELDGRRVHALARTGDEWWAIVDRTTVARRDHAGSWTEIAHADVELTCVLPAPDGAWCGTVNGRLLRCFAGRLASVEAFDRVEGRASWHGVPAPPAYVRSLSTTSDARVLLAGVHVGGIVRSGNGGGSWVPTIDVEVDVHEVRAHPSDPRLVLAPAGCGLAVSRDGGSSWSMATSGLHADYLRAVAFTTAAALVSASDGPVGETSALYRWTDVGDPGVQGPTQPRPDEEVPMVKVAGGLPEWLDGNVDTGALDACGEVAAFADQSGTAYRSLDGGATWTVLAAGSGPVHAVGVAPEG